METIEKYVNRWNKSNKFYCPKCNKSVKYPDYYCSECDVKLKIKVNL